MTVRCTDWIIDCAYSIGMQYMYIKNLDAGCSNIDSSNVIDTICRHTEAFRNVTAQLQLLEVMGLVKLKDENKMLKAVRSSSFMKIFYFCCF